MSSVDINVRTLSDGRDVTVVQADAEITITDNDGEDRNYSYSAVGTARRDPTDEPDALLSVQLAAGRAIRDLGRQMHRHAQRAIAQQSVRHARQTEASIQAARLKADRAAEARARHVQKTLQKLTEVPNKGADVPTVTVHPRPAGIPMPGKKHQSAAITE